MVPKQEIPLLSVVAPAYNEEEIIEETIQEWEDYLTQEKLEAEIVICDDGSTDQTGKILTRLQKIHPNLAICTNQPNRGYGYALQKAIKQARGKLIMTLDSDGQFDIKEFKKLYHKLTQGHYDCVAGYRYKKRDNLARILADRGFNLIMRTVFSLNFKDTNCAQKLYRRALIQKIKVEARGYPAPTEIIVKAREAGWKIGEVPVVHYERKKGMTKLKLFKTSIDVLKFLVYLRFKLHNYRRRIIHSL